MLEGGNFATVSLSHNHVHNILRLSDCWVNFYFTISEAKRDS